ncbi:MAG TPA: carboxylesterase family protein [Stellaceae bacterium]|nr:carboxylesterase family protein [Stellaceae bacterium]
MTLPNTTVQTGAGLAVGVTQGNVRIYRGIRYGDPAIPKTRFSGLVRAQARDGLANGQPAAFPQKRSRLADLMGDAVAGIRQEEEAFLLDLWAPCDAENLPVLVFLHGGAFISGGGSGTRYDGARLASEEDLIVITLNYRLGALGHLCIDGVCDGNLPFGDILQALQWIQENACGFGGNPDNVTVAGQSAGAWYAHLLAVSRASKGLLRRNILLSLPYYPPMLRTSAEHLMREFSALVDHRDLRSVPIEEVLSAQVEIMKRASRFGDLTLGFYPVVSGDIVPEWLFDYPRAAAVAHIESTLIGYTRDENAAFLFGAEATRSPTEKAVTAWYESKFGADGVSAREHFDKLRSAPTSYTALVDGGTELSFAVPARSIAHAFSNEGIKSWMYRFDLQSGSQTLLGPHCLELPFLFGNREDWRDASMLEQIDDVVFERVSAQFRHAIAEYSRGRSPSSSPGSIWSAYSSNSRKCNVLDSDSAASIIDVVHPGIHL